MASEAQTNAFGAAPSLDKRMSFNGKQLLIGESLRSVGTNESARFAWELIGAALWDVETGQKVREFLVQPGTLTAATISPRGGQVATASWMTFGAYMGGRGPASLWDIATGKVLWGLGIADDFVFSPDGRRVVCSSDSYISMFDAETGRQLFGMEARIHDSGNRSGSYGVNFSPDSRRVAVVSLWKITVCDSTSSNEVCTIQLEPGAPRDTFYSAQFSPDGKLIVSQHYSGTSRVWDATTGRQVQVFTAGAGGARGSIVIFTPDGQQAISGSGDGLAILWDVKTGKEIRRFQIPGVDPMSGDQMHQMIISRDGKRLITSCQVSRRGGGGPERIEMLWDLQSGQLIKEFDEYPRTVNGAYRPGGKIVGFSPVDETFITVEDEKPLALWDAATGKIIRQYNVGH